MRHDVGFHRQLPREQQQQLRRVLQLFIRQSRRQQLQLERWSQRVRTEQQPDQELQIQPQQEQTWRQDALTFRFRQVDKELKKTHFPAKSLNSTALRCL